MTWNPDLTIDDIDTLLDVIKEWERGGPVSELETIQKLKTVNIDQIPGADDPVIKEKMTELMTMTKDQLLPKEPQVKADAKVRMERATLIRAKLILLQQSLAADKAFE